MSSRIYVSDLIFIRSRLEAAKAYVSSAHIDAFSGKAKHADLLEAFGLLTTALLRLDSVEAFLGLREAKEVEVVE